jgi:hypothetical protein
MATLDQIEDYIRRREFTDYIMPIWLPFLPLILMIGCLVWFLVFFTAVTVMPSYYHYDYYYHHASSDVIAVGALAILFVIAIVATAINVYVVYKWVNRRNEHFKRQRLLFRAITDYLKSKGCEVSRLEPINMEMEVEENERSAVLWALIQFVPYVGGFLLLYVYHFLNKDFWKHERREDQFLNALSSILAKHGVNFTYVRMHTIPDRSTLLYVILLFVTIGLFGLYWVYTLTKDPNNHFMEHRRWEDTLLNALRSL